jgi:exopolysaccharide biosynthesis polyprenyl glycosylphosphotransferase
MARRKLPSIWHYELLADILAIITAYFATLLIRFHSEAGVRLFRFLNNTLRLGDTSAYSSQYQEFYIANAPRILFILISTICVIYALRNAYSGIRFIRQRPLGWQIFVSNAIALGLFYAYFYLTRNQFHPRSFFLVVIAMNVVVTTLFRSMLNQILQDLRTRGKLPEIRAVLVGNTEEAGFIATLIREMRPHGIQLCTTIPTRGVLFPEVLRHTEEVCRKEEPSLVIVADNGLTIPEIMQVLELGALLDSSVKVLSNKFHVLVNHAHIDVDMIHVDPLVHFDAPSYHARYGRASRLLSMFTAGFLLMLFLPLLLLIGLLIKATSRGPVFFVQERIGVNRVPFRMYKFRTMFDRAEEMQAQIEEFNESGAGLFKMKKDPRVTPVGRWLRRFSLDELPQFINIVRGEMSFVGPRPLPRRDFENYYEEWHYSRHSGMPGVTCLWQVSGRSDIDFHNMCILDIYYLSNHNWILDLQILLRTIRVVLFAKGAY